jgi:hypothetical protein
MKTERDVAENDQPLPDNQIPGVPIDIFEAGVRVLAELRDTGKYLIFLGRQTSVKLVGDPQDFLEAIANRLERAVTEEEAKKALTDIRNFCMVGSYYRAADQTVRFLEHNIYDDEFEGLKEEAKESSRQVLRDKVGCVSKHLLTVAMEHRGKRMETATGPCLEELDVELVSERHDDFRGASVKEPFLRLRLRYSEGTNSAFPFFMLAGPRWGGVGPLSVPSFEFECDESDIDLLIFRLAAAKRLLLRSEENEAEQEH